MNSRISPARILVACALAITALFAIAPGSASAGPGFGLQRLRQASATGLEDYLYTAGNTIFAQGAADANHHYRIRVSEPGSVIGGVYTPGAVHGDTGCKTVPSNKAVSTTYTVASSDPTSGQFPWQVRLDEWTTATCSGNPSNSKSLYFDNVKAGIFSDSAMTMPKTVPFMAGGTAWVSVKGIGNVNKGNPTANQTSPTGSWSTTWILPSLLNACANTGGGDRADNTATGTLPSTSPLEYQPASLGDTWNRFANYDNGGGGQPCPAMSSSNQGQWQLNLKRDNTHFVRIPVFSVDTTPPDTSISGAPAEGATSGVSTANFALTASEPGTTFQCDLDGGGFGPCSLPLTGLSDAPHTFSARAIDPAGNVDPTPAVRHWTVDTTRPHVTLTTPVSASPPVALTDSTPTLGGAAGNDPSDITTVNVNVYAGSDTSGSVVRTFSVPTGGGTSWSVDVTPALPDGTYTVQATQSDDVGPATTEAHTFVIDTQPPTLSLGQPAHGSFTDDDQTQLSGAGGVAALDNATLTVNIYSGSSASGTPLQTLSNVAIGASGLWTATPASLADGVYTAQATQQDSAGNTGLSAPHTFTVDTTNPDTILTGGMSGNTGSSAATFTFTSTEAGSTFACSLDNGPFGPCASPKSYSGLGTGTHTFQVQAIDRAGNADDTPATVPWTIATNLPAVTLVKPVSGSATNDTTPTFAGDAGTATGDSSTVTVKVFPLGSNSLVESVTATRSPDDGAWSVDASPALPEGAYVAHAEQAGSAGTGFSSDHTFTIDTTAPHTMLTALPQTTTSSTSATFTFSSSQTGSTFQCSLDSAAFTTCTSPAVVSGLSDGQHTFSVRAIDPAGNVDGSPATQTWTVNTTLPAVTITAPAANASLATTNPAISGTASTAGGDSATVTVDVYALQPGQPLGSPVQSPTTTRDAGDGSWSLHGMGLTEGTYVAFARQTGAAGQGVSAGVPFTVDLSPPATMITAAPQGTTASTTATLKFKSSEPNSTFKCSLNGAPFTDCTSPQTYSGLADNGYTFEVEAIDAAGNVDPDPASTGWTVDTTNALNVTINSLTNGATNSATPAFTGHAATGGGVSGVTVEVFDTDGNSVATYGPVTPAGNGNWTTSGVSSPAALPDGDYTAVAEQNDSTSTTFSSAPTAFTVDTQGPSPTLDAPASGLQTTDTTPAVSGEATSDPGDAATVTVKIYSGKSATGTPVRTLSGLAVNGGAFNADVTTALPDGTYTARAEQNDTAGNTGFSNRRTFTVDTTTPDTTITAAPNATTTSTDATLSFTSNEAGATFSCSLDGGSFTACTSPATFNGLAVGAHTFSVRAMDGAGNTDATPATATWTVNAPATTPPGSDSTPTPTQAPTTTPTDQFQTQNPDELILAFRLGGCTLRLDTLRQVGLKTRKGVVRIGLLSREGCTIKGQVLVTLPKTAANSARAKAKAVVVKTKAGTLKLAAGKRRVMTLRFSAATLKSLKAVLAKKKTLTATITLSANSKTHRPGAKKIRIKLSK